MNFPLRLHPKPAAPLDLLDALPEALASGEFWPAFQSLIHLRSGTISGFEVLARWASPRFGNVTPAVFLPLAESAGLLPQMTIRLVSSACAQAAHWGPGFFLSFNLKPSMLQDTQLPGQLLAAIQPTGFPLDRVKIEITEDAEFLDNDSTRQAIDQLKAAGLRLSLDDFGTGHSSLTRLHALPFDEIKIDASFVRDLELHTQSLKIVTAVIGLGQSLGMHVVAEGIESQAQVDILKGLGCMSGQGFLFSRPVHGREAQALLKRLGLLSMQREPVDLSPYQRLHQLESLYKDAPIGLCFIDMASRVVSANKKMTECLALGGASVEGVKVEELLWGAERRQLLSAIESVKKGNAVPPTEYHCRHNGATYLIAHQQVLDERKAPIGISLLLIDITQRIAAHQALQANEDNFQQASALSQKLTWAAGPDGRVNYVGRAFESAAKVPWTVRYLKWKKRMDAEDKHRVRKEWLAHLSSLKPFHTTFLMMWPDATWRWVRSQAFPLVNVDGTVKRWYGVVSDITNERILMQKITSLEAMIEDIRRRLQRNHEMKPQRPDLQPGSTAAPQNE